MMKWCKAYALYTIDGSVSVHNHFGERNDKL